MKPRYSLPSERPVVGADASLLRAGWPLLALLILPSIGAYLWQGFTRGIWGGSLIGLAVAVGFGATFWHGLMARITECRSRVYQRIEQPIRYWFSLVLWLMGYGLGVASLIWAHSPR